MLVQLNIKNFALIEEISVQFNEGFNILSGETGAGKSILIDAIDYVLGGKFSKDLIRTGKDKTFVEAIFSIENNNVVEVLNEFGIEYEDLIIISRETSLSGKSIIRVNGRSLISMQLKKIREKLLDIHGQHQNQNLLQKNNHIVFLDNYIGLELEEPLNKYLSLREKFFEIEKDIKRIGGNEESSKIVEYTKFQIDDIEKGKLSINEEEQLKEEFNILSNAEKINSSLRVSYDLINNPDGGNSVLEALSKVISELNFLEKHIESIKEKKELLEGAYYNIQEISRDIRCLGEEIVYDENRLSKINERIYEINSYKKKYGPTIQDVLDYYIELKKKCEELVNSEEILLELQKEKESLKEKMKKSGHIIHDIRCKYSKELEARILDELSYVGLDKSRIKIEIEENGIFNEKGIDVVSFLISTNAGEPLKPLEKVLSGGELSRIMLALKCVYADKDLIPTLIFDEIDTGISGAVGQRVGEKMYQVSLSHQVVCITHLPQIAILSDQHYFLSKEVKGDKTFTNIRLLSVDEKIKQVSSMLSGDGVTESTINNVKEMLKSADYKKDEIKSYKNT